MLNNFPEPIKNLPEAEIPFNGITAHLSQAKNHQIVFMEFKKNVDVPEHSHSSQWEIVIGGKIEICIDGILYLYKKGDSFYIPAGVKHYAKVYAGYRSLTFFNEKERYKIKKK
jgi:quercetin dioxygenase-like cupin family protein